MLRDAVAEDVEALARLRFDGWQDAHAEVLPAELRRLPTPASFRERLREGLAGMRVAQRGGAAVGFAMLKGDELYQFYVSAEARGSGVAAQLLADALTRLAIAGAATAWLACAIGNDRAARFTRRPAGAAPG